MKTYPKFLIKLDVADTLKFLNAVQNALGNGWTRLPDVPCEFDGPYRIFQRDRPGHQPVALFILRDDAETLSVVNIVPRDHHLTIDEYRAVLLDFQASVLDKVVNSGFEIAFFLSSGEIHVENLLHPAAFRQLQRFGVLANKDTGSLHVSDRDQWIAFLIAHHRSQRDTLTPHVLGAWLREQHFSEDAIFNLKHEFDFGLAALKLYDDYLAYLAQHPPALPLS